MRTQSIRGTALVAGRFRDATVAWRGSEIVDVAVHGESAEGDGRLVLPGLIDLHVHGGGGADFMDGEVDAAGTVVRHHLEHGTTALAATTLSGSRDAIDRALDAITRAASGMQAGSGEIVAVHFEGPYLNREKAGAQDPSSLRPPDEEELASWIERASPLSCIMTIAPELPGAYAMLRRFSGRVLFSIGHTKADAGTTEEALRAGARHFTHLFNAMPPLLHRDPGPPGVALASDHATAEIIADGFHVDPHLVRTAWRAMGDRLALVTDAMRACGMPPGNYKLYRHDVTTDGSAARLSDGTLAGSILTMIGAVRNAHRLCGIPLADAVGAASSVPARIAGIERRKGSIAPGMDADLLIVDGNLTIERVISRGVEVEAQ